jgi:ABC-type transporter Mla MlaB component
VEAVPTSEALLVLRGVVTTADLPALAARVRSFTERGTHVIVCDVGGVVSPCLGTVEVLARLALIARRGGGELTLRRVTDPLGQLLELVGLDDALSPLDP